MIGITAISQQIWDMKYRFKSPDGEPVDKTVEDSWRRVARALAAPEKTPEVWAERFFDAIKDFEFLPAGRIIAGAGTKRKVTLFNCFVMGSIPDDMTGIFESLTEAALTLQQGGGIGYDFSTLRPKGAPVKGVGADASGPLSFMDVWDAMCRTIMSAGSRRGAMMATLRCDHPDIEAFIDAKREPGRLRMFNLSVLVTDALMDAVRSDSAWELSFDGVCHKTIGARQLWDKIMAATYDCAEPGVIFIDRVNARNNLQYCEEIHATNPCGEQPLPAYGACLLGSINLARLVRAPFEATAALDLARLRELVPIAVRMMDNVIDISDFPLSAQAAEARAKRRIGLGITGLADALIMCRTHYGSAKGVALAQDWVREIQRAAYLASTELAAEKGAFELFDAEPYLGGETVRELDGDIRDAIAKHGIRNALLTSVAPTGTISLFADNVSSGLEPVYSFTYSRAITLADGSQTQEEVTDYATRLYRRLKGENAPLPDYFTDAQHLRPHEHIAMQAAVQKLIDSSISKTINLPVDISFEDFKDIYLSAYDTGCKGCTTYRPNAVTGTVLAAAGADAPAMQRELAFEAPPARPDDIFEAGAVVYMTQPLSRPEELPGKTYKIKWPESDHAVYITINDIIQDSRRRPFEIFINTKNMENFAWMVALTRMISAVFRRGGDVSFVVEELKAVFDPRGGHWVDGKYVPSLLAAIGGVIEAHMIDIGFVTLPEGAVGAAGADGLGPGAVKQVVGLEDMPLRQCPKCGQAGVVRQENCDVCVSCAYSKCG